ncbi:hypothetical protein HYZ98_02325 [Candidatus Peregrinibacteria bacterium]|nr:hypothetical protein [Candidatus Peregrinibacteria bacterium]
MEHPVAGDVLFLDVDLFPDEAGIDFSTEPMKQRKEYHTVGRWCALHGDSILQAGMHHLEAQFDFAALKRDLSVQGIETMTKFTDFPELQQAFTTGEQWNVDPARLTRALQTRAIDAATFEHIRTQGHAIGSHLENLERNSGYKGFNKSGVDAILRAVDPQRAAIQQEIATTLSKNS